jgi:hypothetical protein
MAAHAFPPHRIVGTIDFLEELLDRDIQRAVGVAHVGAGFEERLVGADRAEVLAVPDKEVVVLEERAVGLAGHARHVIGVDLLGDRVEPLVLVVDEQPAVRLAGRRETHLRERPERERVANERGVLPAIAEDDGGEPEELLSRGVPVERHEKSRLGRTPAARAARADRGVANLDTAPLQVGGVVRVEQIGLSQLPPVPRVDGQPDLLERGDVEEVRRRLRHRRRDPGKGEHEKRHTDNTPSGAHGSPHSENWKRKTVLEKDGLDATGPARGRPAFRM